MKDLKFKGQVRPYHHTIRYRIDIRKIIKKPVYMAWADAVLKIKDRTIYFAKDVQVGLFQNLTWDFGGDPALDTF